MDKPGTYQRRNECRECHGKDKGSNQPLVAFPDERGRYDCGRRSPRRHLCGNKIAAKDKKHLDCELAVNNQCFDQFWILSTDHFRHRSIHRQVVDDNDQTANALCGVDER